MSADRVDALREQLPAERQRSIMGGVLRHLTEPPRGLEEPQWLMLAAVIVSGTGDPWDDDEVRGALTAHARRSTLTYVRRAALKRGLRGRSGR